jgi:hypothetical protein
LGAQAALSTTDPGVTPRPRAGNSNQTMLEQEYPAVETPTTDPAPADVGTADAPTSSSLPELLRARRPSAGDAERLRRIWLAIRMPLAVYAATRLLYMAIALIDMAWHGWSLSAELSNWDGVWYALLAQHGYPSTHQIATDQLSRFALYESHDQTTLGFMPLFPMVIWVAKHIFDDSIVAAGTIISTIGGFVAVLLVQRLAKAWWGEPASRRAVLFFCVFPGSIVFSMAYSEGLSIALVAGCLLALQNRRWVTAGICAALATAVAPVSLAIIPACAAASAVEFRRRGWRDREARRSLWAPLLSPLGVLLFGLYLWIHSGTPLASYNAQRHGWGEKSTPWAIINQAKHVIHEVLHVHSLHHPGIDLNRVVGVLGAIFLLWAFWLMYRTRPRMSPAAIVLTVWTGVLTLTSVNTPPNPRMLICGFPALMVVAYRCKGKAFVRLIVISTVLLVAMSFATYVGVALRP